MDFYVVDAKTGKCRGPVVMDPWDDISVEELYPDNDCGECPVWLADAESDEHCANCSAQSKYVVHIPTNTCHKLEPDGTVVICGAVLKPKVDGEVFWRYSDVYFEKVVVPVDPRANH